jgi:protein SCO1/2
MDDQISANRTRSVPSSTSTRSTDGGGSSLSRRRLLATAAGLGVGGTAGCLDAVGFSAGGENTYLKEPDSERQTNADLPYPVYGEALPEATVPAALRGERVSTTGFDRSVVLTFFYSHCQTICPLLTSTLRKIQVDAAENGYADEVALVEVTFDPERDTAERLRTYAENRHVDLDAGNWFFLRPETPERAKAVVEETFGLAFEKTHPEDMDMYMFNHGGLILLVNPDGYVERPYYGTSPDWTTIRDDLKRLRERVDG